MKACIQTIPERSQHALEQLNELGLPATFIYTDHDKIGPFKAFIETLKAYPSGDEYRLHMQDDITFCDGFKDYLPEVERLMREGQYDLLSLFAPRRKHMDEQFAKGKRVGTFPNFLWMQCVVMSPWLVERLLAHSHQYDDKHDDVYVAAVLDAYKRKAYVHLPSLVQHDVSIPSSVGHANNDKRTSRIFDKDFVTNWKATR